MPEQVCRECKRGNRTEGNEVVFCDNCHDPYHQMCHFPTIDPIVVEIPEARWFCHSCSAKQKEDPLETGRTPRDLEPEVRMAYLSTLSQSQLIQLIRYAETLDPQLPLYPPNAEQIVAKLQNSCDQGGLRPQHRRNYEDLVSEVVSEFPDGIALNDVWSTVERKKGAIDAAFKHSATRALQRTLRKGRITKRGGRYYSNNDYQPASDLTLTQLLKADDDLMFGYMPQRIAFDKDDRGIEESDVFSHKVYKLVS